MARRGNNAQASGQGCCGGCLWMLLGFFLVCLLIGSIRSCLGLAGTGTSGSPATPAATTQAATTDKPATTTDAATADKPATTPATTAKSPDTPKKDDGVAGASGTMTVRFVDVGQGDATVVEFPDGKTLVCDAGYRGGSAVNSVLRADGRGEVTWLVASHPDSDHIGGLADVIRSNKVGSVWAPEVNHPTKTYNRFLQAVADKNLMIDACVADKRIGAGAGYTIDLLWPPDGATFEDTNEYSAVVLVTYGKTRLLLTGDAPVESLRRAGIGHVDVLKVSHHGSTTGTDASLARELSPSVSVLSYAVENKYGHPKQAVLDALANAGSRVLGTGAQGTVTVTSDGSKIDVSTERSGTVVAGKKG